MRKYDVVYGTDSNFRPTVGVEPHYCREWDERGGCYGTNPDHGCTWEEARERAAEWHENQAAYWRTLKEENDQ